MFSVIISYTQIMKLPHLEKALTKAELEPFSSNQFNA